MDDVDEILFEAVGRDPSTNHLDFGGDTVVSGCRVPLIPHQDPDPNGCG